MNDEETNLCKRCGIDFSVKRRKHHCRMCGLIVCASCSKNRVQLKKSGRKSRVCNECFNQIAPRHMRSVSSKATGTHSNTPSLRPKIDDTVNDQTNEMDDDDDDNDEDDDDILQFKPSPSDYDPNTAIIHEQATSEEVEQVIENLRQAAINRKRELKKETNIIKMSQLHLPQIQRLRGYQGHHFQEERILMEHLLNMMLTRKIKKKKKMKIKLKKKIKIKMQQMNKYTMCL